MWTEVENPKISEHKMLTTKQGQGSTFQLQIHYVISLCCNLQLSFLVGDSVSAIKKARYVETKSSFQS